MDGSSELPLGDRFEFKFARDLIRYVVEKRMEGLFWVPVGIFANRKLQERLASPFTPQMKAAVDKKLDFYEIRYHKQYNDYFEKEKPSKAGHKKISSDLAEAFVKVKFSIKNFFTYCVILSKYAGYSYLYGVRNAPEDAAILITGTVDYLRKRKRIYDDFWDALQDFAEYPDLIDDELPF